jgi:hypothetical protein
MCLWSVWFCLFVPLGVVHYNSTSLYAKCEQNPMETAHIDIQAYIYIYIIKVNIYLGIEKSYESIRTYS